MKKIQELFSAKSDYVTLEQGEALKNLGFEPVMSEYQKAYGKNGEEANWTTTDFHCWKPTVSNALKWIQSNHRIFTEILLDRTSRPKFCTAIWKWHDVMDFEKLHETLYLGGESFEHLHKSQEELESEALTFILDYLIKNPPKDTTFVKLTKK